MIRLKDTLVFDKSDFGFNVKDLPARPEPLHVLMSSPEYFNIVDVKNVHMANQQGKLNRELALIQWVKLKAIYKKLYKKGLLSGLSQVNGQKDCEDMVFAANQSFPWITQNGERVVIMSKMRHESRQKEVPFFREFYKEAGYTILELKGDYTFEGMGDTIPHPGRRLLYGGYGHRSSKEAYYEISNLLHVPIVTLELVNDKFYHLDTCFVPLDEDTVMICPEAFSTEGLASIYKLFRKVIEIPLKEAADNFALNAHTITDGKTKVAILQKGSPVTVKRLQENGFEVIEKDTSEYMKSGGSVFCMKMMIY